MARKRRRKRKPTPHKPAAAPKAKSQEEEPPKSPRPYLFGALAILVLAIAATLFVRFASKEAPSSSPATALYDLELESLDDLDPLVAEQIRQDAEALRQDSANGAAYGRLGRTYHAHGYSELARRCYEIARQIERDSSDWPYYLALLANEEGDL